MDSMKKILVIESVEGNIAQLEQLLAGVYRIAVAFNNDQGFEEAKSPDRPDLILISDISDAIKSYELCRQLKNDMNTYTIPILLILDRSSDIVAYRGFEAGAADYISSPFVKKETLSRIETQLRLVELEEKLKQLEVHDSLTGLFNRSYFDEYLKHEWLRARRSESPLGLMLIEIDGFDEYNQHYGHSALEDILKSLAQTIKKRLCRPADMLSRHLVRGFACVLPDTDHPGLQVLAEELMAAVADLQVKHEFAGQGAWLTVSIAIDYVVPNEADQFTSFYSNINKLLEKKPAQDFGRIIFPDF